MLEGSTQSKQRTMTIESLDVVWERGALVHVDMRGGKTMVIRYRPEDGDCLHIHADNFWGKIPADEVIKAARDMQSKQRQEPKDVEDVDHQNLLRDLLKHLDDDDGTVQVLEGDATSVRLEHFSGNTPGSLIELIHFIKTNSLQDTAPWCVVWNLYRCLMVVSSRS